MFGIVDYLAVPFSGSHASLFWYTCFSLIPNMNAFPGPRSVLLLDNVGFHYFQPFLLVLQMVGVLVIYLPRYAPFLAIIEKLFNTVKAAARKIGPRFQNNPRLCLYLILEYYKTRGINYLPDIFEVGYGNHCMIF